MCRALSEAGDAGQDFVRAFGPDKGFRIGIVRVKKLFDGALQLTLRWHHVESVSS